MRNRKRHRTVQMLTAVLLVWSLPQSAQSQCFGGVWTYEKTPGTTVMCSAGECNSRGLLTLPDTSVTRDCLAICKTTSNCNSFTVDYLNSRCQSYDIDSNTPSGRNKLAKDSIVNYFEKICLRGILQNEYNKLCNSERGWTFERVVDGSLEGYDHKVLEGIESRSECARLCLLEKDFDCRSAEYDAAAKGCALSREDRRTQPEAFRSTPGKDYIENQCGKALPDCSYSAAKQDVTVVAMDDILFSRSAQDCQRFCDDARAFNCRSFAQKDDRCFLSGDDSVTLKDVPQPVEIGATYKEKICARSTCDGGMFTYEKTTGHFLRTAMQEPLSIDSSAPGITTKCSELCSAAGSDCPAFALDYGGQRCFKLDRNTQGRGDSLAARDGSSYFEKTCLRGGGGDILSKCRDKAWSFERIPGKELAGFDDKQHTNVASRRDCQELCLKEKGFACMSAEYDSDALVCVLSKETRRSQPKAFKTARNVDYLENECIKSSDLSCPYEQTENAYPRYLDAVINDVNDEVACEVQCTFHEPFVCRSFAFYPSALQCFISGDDKASAEKEAMQSRPGTDYFERNCDPAFKQPVSAAANGPSPKEGHNDLDVPSHRGGGPEMPPLASGLVLAEQRCGSGGKLSFEKTTGYELIRGSPAKLHSDRDGGIIGECATKCQADPKCQGFNMDYNRNECQAVAKNSVDNLFNLRPNTGVAFFEAICLKGRDCGALWTYERFADMELRGFGRETVRGVSKLECQDRCLKESSFPCASANYDHLARECHLSDESRATQPEAFMAKQGTDYLENQCGADNAQLQSRCDFAPAINDQYLIYTDKVIDAFTEATCKQACIQERDFKCRSFSFLSEGRPGTPQCLLSGDTQDSTGRNAFQLESGAIYAEKTCFGGKKGSGAKGTPPSASEATGLITRPQETDPSGVRQINEVDNDDAVRLERDRNTDKGRDTTERDRDRDTPYTDKDMGIDKELKKGEDVATKAASAIAEHSRNRTQDDRVKGDPGNCKADGLETTFEKIVDYSYNRGDRVQINTTRDIGVIIQCLNECAAKGKDCMAITLQNERGGRQRCFAIDASAGNDGADPVKETGVTYFEKICARKVCRKTWTFTRIPEFEFTGDANEELTDVQSLSECRNLCQESTFYQCRSATYYRDTKICKLSEETRRSAPNDFRPASDKGIDYFENECSDIPSNCEYVDQPGTYLPFTDTYLSSVTDIEECRSQCSAQGQYNCRSFNFNAFRKECFLSADDSVSLASGLQTDRDFTFSERAGCNSGIDFGKEGLKVRVECTPADMVVHLALSREFNGRVYATGNPQNCFELGNGQSDMTLRIPLGSQCGTVQQNRGRYVNHVVIQENPVIMQDTDKTVRVECAFTAEDQTVSFKPTAGPGRDESGGGISVTVPFQPTGTNIVTNTAPTPGVRMRVVRKNGETASMVGLGEDLQLRIEIDQESAFGLFARRLEARTDNGELMNLIDEAGCPVNELIFPALDLEESTRALFADFKAFRFPSTPIVNFVATVQFCQELCEPTECAGDIASYGRRRRELNETSVTLSTTTVSTPHPVLANSLSKNRRTARRSTSEDEDEQPRRRQRGRSPRLLPEHVDLGLRLTVGEDVVQKPFLPSSQGDGHFPERSGRNNNNEDGDGGIHQLPYTEPALNAYYPSLNGSYSAEAPAYICSPPSTLIAVIVIILVINVAMVAGFVIFYRQKRKYWSKRVEPAPARPLSATQLPPPVPSRPPSAVGSVASVYSASGVSFKNPYQQPQGVSRQRITGLHSSMSSLPRNDEVLN